MPLTHILVDFDNKQPGIAELTGLSGGSQRLWIFTSPHSGKFNADYVQALLAHEGRAQLVHCTKSGNNAVDLHIALHLGRLIADHAVSGPPSGRDEFVVVSADKDFVPLLDFVRALGYPVRQVKSLKEALGTAKSPAIAKSPARPKGVAAAGGVAAAAKAPAKPVAAKTAASRSPVAEGDSLPAVIESLRKRPNHRPASVAALGKWLVAQNLPATEVDVLIGQLAAADVLRVEGKKVIYSPEPWASGS
jgi:hypothetical protein